jgi:hypothetical protein
MKKRKLFISLVLIYTIADFCNFAYAITSDNKSDIAFANTVSAGHNSGILMNSVRNEHSTIGDDPSFCFIEKFQVFFMYKDDSRKQLY